MSIKIVPQEQLEEQNNKVSIISKIPLVFYPTPKIMYHRRDKRVQELAIDSPFADYLYFCGKIIHQQAQLVQQKPAIEDLSGTIKRGTQKNLPPLSIDNLALTERWLDYLYPILSSVKGINLQIDHTITKLEKASKIEIMNNATQLLSGKFEQVESNESLFIWSALSVYYAQLASQLPGKAIAESANKNWLCPVCNSLPTASVVHIGTHVGLRYLHCSLCETQWYVPRAKCTNCDNLENITYYSFDDEHSATKTECCGHCHSYLKIFNQDRDPHLEIVADDIASLMLDAETEKKGFAKSGINAFLFSS